MRRAALALLLGAVMLVGCQADGANEKNVLTLHRATMVGSVDGQPLPPQTLVLPLHWDVSYKGKSGQATLTLAFAAAPGAAASRELHGLYIARLGNAYDIELNGVLLGGAGALAGARDRWSAKYPVYLSFPARLLQPDNELKVRIRADAGYRAGLSTVLVGPALAVAPIARRAELLRVALPLATAVLSLLVASFCVLLWWQQRDPLYAWAGIGEALWAVSVADTVIETAPLPWPYWGMSLLLLRAAWAWTLYCIAQAVCGARPKAEYRSMLAVQAAMPLCIVAMVLVQSTQPLLVWYALNFVVWIWVITRLAAQALHEGGAERWMVVLALLAVVVASLRDVVAGRFSVALYDESAWAKYVATLVGVAMMWIVSRRFLSARAEVLALNASLTSQVELKEQELRRSFERLGELERSRAVLAERERILRDLHDGVGANLATAVRQLESGRALPHEVVQTLRESMDHLKLSIDAMNLPAGDVNALLASLRYRLQARLESAGITVAWQVDELPRWTAGSDEAMRHLQFLLLEVISNVLQHAAASVLTLNARAIDDGIQISLSDNGRGMTLSPEHGLRSLHQRADAIGATLQVEPNHPGTRVGIALYKLKSAQTR